MTSETIRISCVMLPDGKIGFMPEDRGAMRSCTRAWLESLTDEQRAVHLDAHTFGGAVIVRLLKSDYENMPATNRFPWPE